MNLFFFNLCPALHQGVLDIDYILTLNKSTGILLLQGDAFRALCFYFLRLWRKPDHIFWNILLSKLPVTLPPKCRVLLEHQNKPRQPALPLLLRFPPGGEQHVLL